MPPFCYILWSTLQYRHGVDTILLHIMKHTTIQPWGGTILLNTVKNTTIHTWGWNHLVTYCEAQYNTGMGMVPFCYILWSMLQYRNWYFNILLHTVKPTMVQTLDGTILLHNVKHTVKQTWVCNHLLTQGYTQGGGGGPAETQPPLHKLNFNTDVLYTRYQNFMIYSSAEVSHWNQLMISTLKFWGIKNLTCLWWN
jgi:hypothetical protein